MKLIEVRKFLENNFKNNLGKMIKRKYSFYRDIGDLYFNFGIAIVDSDNSFPSTFYYGIGNLKYSNLFNFLIKQLHLNFQENKYMIAWGGGQVSLYEQGKYPILEYNIYSEKDAKKMVDEVSDYILNNLLPEWEVNPTLNFLEQKVNDCLTAQNAIAGTLLAKLTNNPNYDELKAKYRELLKDLGELDKQELEKVISFLDKHTKEELEEIASKI